MKPGATFTREQSRVFEQIWLPAHANASFEAHALLM